MAMVMLCTSCDCSTSRESDSQVFRILPRNGMMAWVTRSRACLAEPPAESPSTRNSSPRSGSWLTQSASLPGSAAPAPVRLRSIFWLSLHPLLRFRDRQHGDLLALVRMLIEP